MQKGGPLMWLILLCSVVSVAVVAERLLYYRRASIDVGEFLQGLSNLLRHRRYAEARVECQAAAVPVARVIQAAISRHHLSRSELREIVQEAGQLEVPKLERNLGILVAIGYVAPLLGLLGTVTGLIQAFVQLSANNGYATLAEVSGGIYQSLLTTAGGLVVAIPTILAYCHLSARLNALLHEMTRAGIEVVNLVSEAQNDAEIIQFGQTGPASPASLERR